MELVERDDFLATLEDGFRKAITGEGHCFFITGESGIGKTSLVKSFLKKTEDECVQFVGACDSLFTPRPLAPLYDLALQIDAQWINEIRSISSRTELFSKFVYELTHKLRPVVVVFEDIHWADEATLDFVKFFSRRISRTKCLFILTFRDEEINQQHPVRNVLGELVPGSFTRLALSPLSRDAVQQMAVQKGFDGEEVYNISGGNPFYVNEILASYSPGVPESVKDSVLVVYSRLSEETRSVWQLLSIIPEGLELERFYTIDPSYQRAVESCLANKILIISNGKIHFKHELYRRTVESSLSPFQRISLNKHLLELFFQSFEEKGELEKIVHVAKNANENKLVVQYAPLAAKKAATLGAHNEASRLYLAAIEYSENDDADELVALYEGYAYECYLTNQIKDAIIYQTKALKIWREKDKPEPIGNSLRFLSRLWWFEGNRQRAEALAREAVEILDGQPSSKAKAMAFSNMSQLKMLSDQTAECIFWGEKAIAIARKIGDEETVAHALNGMGSTLMLNQGSSQRGIDMLEQSLRLSLANSFHEHVARAYTALGSNAVSMKNYQFAAAMLDKGISYCQVTELDSLKFYMLSWKARLNLETGKWDEAMAIANNLLLKENLLSVIKIGVLVVAGTIRLRRGEADALETLLEAKKLAFATTELQRIVPVLTALMEYEWVTGKKFVDREMLNDTANLFISAEKMPKKSRFFFWLGRLYEQYPGLQKMYGRLMTTGALQEAASWQRIGCPYEHAMALFDGNEDDKRSALSMVQGLGAVAVYEKMKLTMRSSGIKRIPRGIRQSTKTNPAQLTNRELDVLHLLNTGVQNREIAQTLFISPKTVDHHISSILFKLDVNSRSKAVREAARLGIVK